MEKSRREAPPPRVILSEEKLPVEGFRVEPDLREGNGMCAVGIPREHHHLILREIPLQHSLALLGFAQKFDSASLRSG